MKLCLHPGGSSGVDTLKIKIGISEERFTTGNYDNPYRESDGKYSVPETAHHKNEVYATAIFTGNIGGVDQVRYILTSDDTKRALIPSNPNLFSQFKVGNGVHVQLDGKKPDGSIISSVDVTSDGEPLDDDNKSFKAGDKVRVAVKIGGGGPLSVFGERDVQIKLVGTPPAHFKDDWALQGFPGAKTFTADKVFAASGDSLRHTFTLAKGSLKVKAKRAIPASEPNDYSDKDIAKDDKFDAVYLEAKVQVVVRDLALNTALKDFKNLRLDTGEPEIALVYPDPTATDPDSSRFSGVFEDEEIDDVDVFLKPLRFAVNEETTERAIFVVDGPDTLVFNDDSSLAKDIDAAMDTITYSTARRYDDETPQPDRKGEGLHVSLKEKADADDEYVGTGQGGKEIELAIIATDRVGNSTTLKIPNVYHDEVRPELKNWFPKNSLLEESDNKINAATVFPVITLPEDVDSIAVTFTSSGRNDIVQKESDTAKGETQIDIDDVADFEDGADYTMTVFIRDLAGNVYITPADSSADMTFDAGFDNPKANSFEITTKTDSVIAGQANKLIVQAIDISDEDETIFRKALTYKNKDADDNLAFDVLVSAWDIKAGDVAEKVWFEGKGVDDDAENPDGMATLDADGWILGKRTIHAKSNQAYDHIKVLIQHRTAGDDGTGESLFDGELDELYVGAADFNGFEITAWEEGVEGAATSVWGDFTLRVVPVDRYGNASVRAFKAGFDSLDVLDTRVKNAFEYKDGIDVTFASVPSLEELSLLVWPIGLGGETFDVVAPENKRSVTIQVRVENEALKDGDTRSENIRSTDRFAISAPLTPVLTLWVPGTEGDQAGNDVVIPADPGDVTVTVAAAGFNAGSDITFTKDGTALDALAADDDGNASLMITMAAAGTVTVSATDGQYAADDLTIVFVAAPVVEGRKAYVDSNGDAVYLITSENMTVDSADYVVFLAAWGSNLGDAKYNAQADVNDDETVDSADYVLFIATWGKTAVGPATKPIVLLPGVNENAEFSLSLGSERVVAGELMAVDVSLANVAALMGYGFALNYETDKFEFVSVAPADEDLLKSTGGDTPLFHHLVADGQVEVVNGMVNGSAVSGGGDIVRFVFRVLREFEDNARFEIADGLVFDPSQLQNPAVVAGVLELQSTPREFALHQNFPNPFNPDTTIKYDLAESADVTLQIYNVLGQVVRTLVASEAQNAGRYQIRWSGMDDRGVSVSSGIYFYRISAGEFQNVRKLMLLK